MTPERIEEFKHYFTDEQLDEMSREYRTMPTDGEGYAIEPEYEGMVARGNIVKLVSDVKTARAALEESQQQIKELQEGNRSACESRDMAYRSRDETIVTSNQHYKQAFLLNEGLIEAQQTITRQREALEWYANKNNYVVDIDSQWEPIISALEDEGNRARAAMEGNKEEVCCSNPNVQTFNNEFVSNTRCCINCGRL
jgi:hypothetical protein